MSTLHTVQPFDSATAPIAAEPLLQSPTAAAVPTAPRLLLQI